MKYNKQDMVKTTKAQLVLHLAPNLARPNNTLPQLLIYPNQ